MPKREVIDTARAPHTGLPYAQALRYGDLVFVAGQVALDPKTNQPSGGDVAAQTRRVLDNISAILEQALPKTCAVDSRLSPRGSYQSISTMNWVRNSLKLSACCRSIT